ncbi:MAG: 4Fe-4S binding protein [Dissulfurispiraceae bacterium]|nr:4Fe-4S binding protein [Dissulfurispiraceae bacterium]
MSTETNTNNAPEEEPSCSELIKGNKKGFIGWLKSHKLSTLRRFVLLAVVVFFLLQFFRVKLAVGSLTGSLALWFVNLLDVFAYLESMVASKDFGLIAIVSVLPILIAYLIFGRSFCGWVCPMDYLFHVTDRIRKCKIFDFKISPKYGYIIAIGFLVASFAIGIPVFTNYFSHLTNFFRSLTGLYFYIMDLPVAVDVMLFSFAVIVLLLVLELIFPRMWCRLICPVGKVYGLFNKVSRFRLRVTDNDLCKKCRACDRVCYMGVKVSEYVIKGDKNIRDINCILCGRCVEACNNKSNILRINLSLK